MLSPASNPPNTSGREPVSVDASVLPTGAAADTTVAGVTTSLGTDGAAPPVIAGTGVRGFLRAIYDRLVAGIGVTGTFWQATQPVSGTFFQATQPVSAASLPLPTGASTEATLALIKAKTDNLDVAISTRTKPADTQAVSAASLPLPALAATSTKQSDGTQKTQVVDGSGNVQPAGDTSGRAIKVDASATTQPVSATALPLPTGAATDTTVAAVTTSLGTDGATPPSIPGTGVRGWLRSIYDKMVLLVAVFPTTLDMNSGNKSASTMRVVLATDQPTNTNKLAVTATSDQTTHGTTDLAADDVIKWAGTTLSAPVATSPDGTQTAPVFRSLNRKATTIETQVVLAGAATFTGSWHDSNLTGDSYVVATAYASHVGANFFIEESDDTGNANFTRTVATWNGGPAANTLCYMSGVLRTRWWRVRYVNGATLQTSFELTTCAQTMPVDSIITNNTSGTNSVQSRQVQIVQPGGAGAMSDNLALFMTWTAQNAAGQGPQDVMVRFHGGKFSGTAAGTKSGASAARTPTIYNHASTAASGDTALWTPLTGNKFRVLKFKIQLTADAATSGGARITVLLRDATTDIGVGHIVFVPSAGATALNAGYDSGWIDLGQFGYLSTAANAVLNINLSAALTAGLCNVIVAGTEE